ncbi:hypothetical protein W03_05440 [Nitrosomonas sp. PY1]|nr:hypothetical protein W03_05440 [Nitrosomonas sp. PY1]
MVESGMPIVVAYRGSYLAGVLFSAAMDAPSQSPAVIAMRETWSGQTGAYIYGPVCVAPTERGQGLLVKMYASLVDQLPNREAVLFIRQDNIASIRAHKSLGMHQVAQFRFDDNEYLIFSDSKLPPA